MPTAYSYLRFSSPQQAAGDSVRRQVEKTRDWCQRHKARLDESISLRDEGVSAFHGRHREDPDLHALAGFLSAVKTGRVPRGSYLVVESLDRLSRESIRPALTLVLNLIEAGIRVVQLLPAEAVYDENVEPMALMQAIMELNRGHSESKVKSERVGAAWARKRREAATRVVTRKLPGWVRLDGGKLVLDPAGAETIRRLFALAREGAGVHTIAQRLNAEGVPVLGRATFKGKPVVWSETVVYHLLTSRAVIGEYQPHKGSAGRGRGKRQPCGDPIPDYYPAAVEADLFHAVQGVLRSRATCGRGRRGKHINLFAGLLTDARDGGSLTYKHLARRPALLIPVGAKHGRGVKWSSFPAGVFEAAVLSELVEVKASDVWANGDAVHKVEALAGRLAEADSLVKQWTAKMDNPATVDLVAAKLAELSAKRKALAEALAEAQRDAASPLSESWGEFKGLADLLAKDTSDALRLKVRAALRRSVASVHCLFLTSGGWRLAAVQVRFRGSERHRDYLVAFRQARANGHAQWQGAETAVWSLADVATGTLDLRQRGDARRLEAVLARLDLDALSSG